MFKPMKAATVQDIRSLRYPLLASPKLDGFRATYQDGMLRTSNLLTFRNKFLNQKFSQLPKLKLEGMDGELIVGSPTDKHAMQNASSGLTSVNGQPDAKLHCFDLRLKLIGFSDRLAAAHEICSKYPNLLVPVQHVQVDNPKMLLTLEDTYLKAGYEGLMLRSFDGPYKEGRSSLTEGYLMKFKVFEFDDVLVLEIEEAKHNANEATTDNLGAKKRSSHKANMVPMNTTGGFIVEILTGPFKGKIAQVGPGKLTYAQRSAIWADRYTSDKTMIGKKFSMKHFMRGSKDLPRFPLYDGPPTKS